MLPFKSPVNLVADLQVVRVLPHFAFGASGSRATLGFGELVVVSRRDMNLRDMPILLPEIPDDQYHLPELVGRLFDVTVLSRDVLRPLADAWCSMALSCLTRVGQTIRPMRAAAEKRRALAAALIANDAQLQVVDVEP